MPSYEYRCPDCGIVERFCAMGGAASVEACPTCGRAARRVFSAPSLNRTPGRLAAAMRQAEKSRHEPAVVRPERAEPRSDATNALNPALQNLVGKKAARNLKEARHPAKPGR